MVTPGEGGPAGPPVHGALRQARRPLADLQRPRGGGPAGPPARPAQGPRMDDRRVGRRGARLRGPGQLPMVGGRELPDPLVHGQAAGQAGDDRHPADRLGPAGPPDPVLGVRLRGGLRRGEVEPRRRALGRSSTRASGPRGTPPRPPTSWSRSAPTWCDGLDRPGPRRRVRPGCRCLRPGPRPAAAADADDRPGDASSVPEHDKEPR